MLLAGSAAICKASVPSRSTTRSAATAKHSISVAPKPRADDGWVLKFRVKGDIDRRVEYVHTSSYATRGTLPFSGGGEYRSVMVFDEGGVRRFDEPALSASFGAVFNGGVEWTPSGGAQPTVGVSFAGFDAQLEKNQAMIGFVNPAGVGGGRIGMEFSEPGVRVLATSQTYLVSRGGARQLGLGLLSAVAPAWSGPCGSQAVMHQTALG